MLIYVVAGSTTVGDCYYTLAANLMARLSLRGKRLLSGKPMDEPIVFHYGPLLMNIMDEIQQAVEDY